MARPRSISLIAAALALLGSLGARASAADPLDMTSTLTGASFDGRLGAWLSDPFVEQALHGHDFENLVSALRKMRGFAGAYPNARGSYLAGWDGPVPAGVPRVSGAGHPIEHVANVRVRPLIGRPAAESEAIGVSELAREIESTSPPAMTPGPVQGIGPGGAIHMQKANAAGNLLTYICSASYLFQNPSTGTYYLATAGHCLLDENAVSSTDAPAARARWVRLCYADCINNSLGLGKYVQLNPDDGYPGYHPVAWAEQRGIGRDFGFIEIPQSLNHLLRPWLWLWGGPTRFQRPSLGTPLAHYGFGNAPGQATPTQGRLAVTISSSKAGGQGAVGWVSGGDSGSALGTATLRTDPLLMGDAASGAITHGVAGVGFPLMWGTDIEYALDTSQDALGFRPALVLEDGTTGPPPPSPTPGATPSPTPGPTPSPSPEPTPSPSPDPTPSPSADPTPPPHATPSPSPEPSPTASPEPSPAPGTSDPAEREVSLRASRTQVQPGGRVRLRGSMSGDPACVADETAEIRARRGPQSRFRVVATVQTDADGSFVLRVRPRVSRSYRAVAPASEECAHAASRIIRVTVKG